jgi:hypothetical protein
MPECYDCRALWWIYVRGDERVKCFLALDAKQPFYEFSVSRMLPRSSTSIDRFTDLSDAFACHTDYEAALIGDGWSLLVCGRLADRRAGAPRHRAA